MASNTITWDSIRPELLANPEVKAEYDTLEAEIRASHIKLLLCELPVA